MGRKEEFGVPAGVPSGRLGGRRQASSAGAQQRHTCRCHGKSIGLRSRNNCRGSDAARELGCPRLARGSFTFFATPADLPSHSPPPRSPAAAAPPLANGEGEHGGFAYSTERKSIPRASRGHLPTRALPARRRVVAQGLPRKSDTYFSNGAYPLVVPSGRLGRRRGQDATDENGLGRFDVFQATAES